MLQLRGLSGNLFPIHPHPLPDELLTSWLMRVAHGNGMKLQALLDRSVGRDVPTMQRDYDRSVPIAHLRRFSEVTGVSYERLTQATLRAYAGSFVNSVNEKGNSLWVLPLGIYHRTRARHGLQFCSECLSNDPIPYYRRSWRLAFSVECPEHRIRLHDSCPRCDAPVVPHRIELGRRNVIAHRCAFDCHACGLDLRRTAKLAVNYFSGDLRTQMRLVCEFAGRNDSTTFGAEYSPIIHRDYFNDWHNLTNLMLSRRRGLTKIMHATAMLVECPPMETPLSRRPIEVARIAQRITALQLGLWAMMRWPLHLAQALRFANVSPRRCRKAVQSWSHRAQIFFATS